MSSDAMRSDARLADVCFVGPRRGWAVGDRGTIWHTDDGGRLWLLQDSGVACPLKSVFFLDENIGWAVGGWTHPYTHTSSGVLLSTRDGGRHWSCNGKLLLPALSQVRFVSDKRGWVVGCRAAMFPSGVFSTDNGGQSWMPLAGDSSGWLSADFLNPLTGALAGRNGSAASVQGGKIEPVPMETFALHTLARLRLLPPAYGWLVGDGGLVLLSRDLGASWQPSPGQLPDEMARQFDFAALAVRGPKVWIAGSPGTRVFHSADAGRTWAAFPTGVPAPIHGLSFVDDRCGWAVGALGTILATTDGGQTWQRQRAGGSRAALLGLFSQADDVPLELFARLSGNEGYLGVVEVLNRRDVESPGYAEVHAADRLHEAVVAVGASDASLAWRFPLRQPGLELPAEQILAGWDRLNGGRGLEELEEHIVSRIRLWRPEVLVTHDASPQGDDPRRHLINQVVLQATRTAADPSVFPRQIAQIGLQPWQVKKVYAFLPPPAHGATELTTAQLATRLGRSLAEAAATPRGLLLDRFSVSPATLSFRLLVNQLPLEQGQRDFFSGIALRSGGDARRELQEPPAESLDPLRRIAQWRRNLEAIIERSENDPQGGLQLLAQAGELTSGLDPLGAGQVLYQLGDRYYQTGKWDLTAQAFTLLGSRYPEHPLARPALLWLVQYYASEEAAWRSQSPRPAPLIPRPSPLVPRPSPDASQQDNPLNRATALGKEIEQKRPDLFAQPALRFPLAAAYRRLGLPRQAEHFYLKQSAGADHDAWWACAQGEKWLAQRKGPCPKPVLSCVRAAAKPHLDGRLDDAVWKQAKSASLHSAQHDDDDWPAAVMLACDGEFLYVGIQCRLAPGAKVEAAAGPRGRDADLSAHDRVDLFFDTDRDFATSYRFAIDHRGFAGEDCWGDRTWNPAWFVAAAAADGCWTAEAAIAWDQLTGRPPAAGDVWAVGIQRIVPGVGFQSWSTPAAVTVVPQGFGYLIFE